MARFVIVRTDLNKAEIVDSKLEVIQQIEDYKKKGNQLDSLPFQIFELGNQLDVKHFVQHNAKVGDIVRFRTGLVCRVVPDGEAVLYIDAEKITESDAAYYLENDACFIVPEDQYVQPNGTLRMAILTDNLAGCLRHGYYAVCNENPDWLVYVSEKGLYQIDDLFYTQDFNPKLYVGNTWTLKQRQQVQKMAG
ncbi:hypothetical protein ACFVS2_22225 [Brevibacillus sp. NPDC058079]|uniref:hypothetical protein n=1 Tax=Brevibacillus sp. NPDC058079 TaxID=3346330 RepID=UPI0036E56869